MSYKASTAKTYLKGKEVGSFIKQNYGKDLVSYTNKDLLKDLDEKYNVSVNYNTLRKEAGRLRSTRRFAVNAFDELRNEGIYVNTVPLEKIVSDYEKDPKQAKKDYEKAKIKGIKKSRHELAKSLKMTPGELEKFIYSDSKKIWNGVIERDDLNKYLDELENYMKSNNLVMAYRLNRKMHEYFGNKAAELELIKSTEEEFEDDIEKVKNDKKNIIKYNIDYFKETVNKLKILYKNPVLNNIKIKFVDFENIVEDEKFGEYIKKYNSSTRTSSKDKVFGNGSAITIFTDGNRAFAATPDSKGAIRDDIKVFRINGYDDKGMIECIKGFGDREFYNLSNNYPPSIMLYALNMHSYNVATGNPNMDYRNLPDLAQRLNDEHEEFIVKRFFSKLGLKFN